MEIERQLVFWNELWVIHAERSLVLKQRDFKATDQDWKKGVGSGATELDKHTHDSSFRIHSRGWGSSSDRK